VLTWLEFAAQWMRTRTGSERGAALVEYALLLTFIAVVCMAALGFMGHQLSESFDSTGQSVGTVN
jgi:pilus assembly protein Flp/PilA